VRTFREIAYEIEKTWPKVWFGAKPYLSALRCLDTTDPQAAYGYDTAKEMALYFLANAATWKGEDARRIKAELKEMLK
jgi:hypothetical protein